MLGTIPAPHDVALCASHSHGLRDIAGYVVTVTRFDAATAETTRDDVAYLDSPTRYAEALGMVRELRARIAAGELAATYAVIDTVYASGCRPI